MFFYHEYFVMFVCAVTMKTVKERSLMLLLKIVKFMAPVEQLSSS